MSATTTAPEYVTRASVDLTIYADGHVLAEHSGRRITLACPHGAPEHVVADHDGYAYVVSEVVTSHLEGDRCTVR